MEKLIIWTEIPIIHLTLLLVFVTIPGNNVFGNTNNEHHGGVVPH